MLAHRLGSLTAPDSRKAFSNLAERYAEVLETLSGFYDLASALPPALR